MRNYLAPVNPLHENPYEPADLWWLDHAWSQEVANELYASSRRGDDTEQTLISAIVERVEKFSLSNLPEMIPTGEFITDLLLRMEGSIPGMNAFLESEDQGANVRLSRPLRLYRHLITPKDNPLAATPEAAISKALLVATEFTDADLQWLLIDGGKDQGLASREEAVKAPLGSLGWKNNHHSAASAYKHGALLPKNLKHFLRNHSVAVSPYYADLVEFIATERDNRNIHLATMAEDNEMILAVVKNPATPTTVLESLVTHLKPELTWMSLADTLRAKSSTVPSVAFTEVSEASAAASRRLSRGPVMADLDWWIEFASLVVWHPNWVGGEGWNLVDPGNYVTKMVNPRSGISTGMLPTTKPDLGASAGQMMEFMTQVPSYHPLAKSRISLQNTAFKHLAFSDLKADLARTHVADVAETAIRQKLKKNKISSADLVNVGFGLGKFLHPWSEVKEAFSEVGETIPEEWLRELAL